MKHTLNAPTEPDQLHDVQKSSLSTQVSWSSGQIPDA